MHAVLLAARTGKGGNAYQAQQCPEAQGDGNGGEQTGFKGEGDLSFSHGATGCGLSMIQFMAGFQWLVFF